MRVSIREVLYADSTNTVTPERYESKRISDSDDEPLANDENEIWKNVFVFREKDEATLVAHAVVIIDISNNCSCRLISAFKSYIF